MFTEAKVQHRLIRAHVSVAPGLPRRERLVAATNFDDRANRVSIANASDKFDLQPVARLLQSEGIGGSTKQLRLHLIRDSIVGQTAQHHAVTQTSRPTALVSVTSPNRRFLSKILFERTAPFDAPPS